MKKFYFFSLLFIFSQFFCHAQQVTAFQKSFGGSHNDYGFCAIATTDGGYAVTGLSNGNTSSDYDVLLIKLDSNANMQWSRTYGGNGNDQASQLVQTDDGGFAIAGKSSSFGAGNFDALLIKTDGGGNLSWMKTYGGPAEDRLLNLRQTSDHGFILAGSTLSFGQGDWDMLFIRTDSVGDTLWTKMYGGINYDQGTDADETMDGGFIFSGRVASWGSGLADVCLVKTNSDGDTLWTRVFGGASWDEGMKVKQTNDGGYIVTGASTSFGNTSYDVYLNKVDSSGHLSWSKLYSGIHNDATYDVLQLADSGYVITGETESFGLNHLRTRHPDLSASEKMIQQQNNVLGTDHSNVFVIRTDVSGDTLWTRAYGGALMDEAYSIIQTRDRGFVIAAYSTSFGNDSVDFYLIKTDSSGFSGCDETAADPVVTTPPTIEKNTAMQNISGLLVSGSINTLTAPTIAQNNICIITTGVIDPATSIEKVFVYPDPANLFLRIRCSNYNANRIQKISITNPCGQEIIKSEMPAAETEIQIDISQIESGLYFIRVGNVTAKFIKL